MRRRIFSHLAGVSGLAGFTSVLFPLIAQQNASSLPEGIGTDNDYDGPLVTLRDFGTTPALKEEVITATQILKKAKGPTPVNVAEYFLAVGNGKYEKEWIPYVKGWPVRWNPLIVSFFEATNTVPEGDVTPWCAAFTNWCFLRATGAAATKSASSGSFRTFGHPVSNPRYGDLVVFQSSDTTLANVGRGHVGFFVEKDSTHITVLGGNQIKEGIHVINRQKIAIGPGSSLKLHSYRKGPTLHA